MDSIPPLSLPPVTDVEIDVRRYPQATVDFLKKNREDSRAFIYDVPERQRWLFNHSFRASADLCIDGRVSDFSEALGLATGLLEMHRSGGAMDSVGSWRYARRALDGNRKLRHLPVGGIAYRQMAEMRFCVVHYSRSRPNDASCAAWNHDTKKAAAAMQRHADVLNDSFRGHMVAMVALVDTDLDAITVIGPGGRFCTAEYSRVPSTAMSKELRFTIKDRLEQIFPRDWPPIAELSSAAFMDAFYSELTEHLMANIEFVRRVIEAKRPIELLDHQERMIFVGRPLETRDHNAAFLIGDTDNLIFFRREERLAEVMAGLQNGVSQRDLADVAAELELGSDFGIAFRIVLGNILADAARDENYEFKIPILISIPHDSDDRELTVYYAKALKAKLELAVRRMQNRLAMKIEAAPQFASQLARAGWLKKELGRIEEHVSFCTTVHDRRSRLFIPCDP